METFDCVKTGLDMSRRQKHFRWAQTVQWNSVLQVCSPPYMVVIQEYSAKTSPDIYKGKAPNAPRTRFVLYKLHRR
ncbi:hypothetical protein GDO81_008166 [Engystomops pustulosus]|uniref:Uncharacterized protein n=1 Tax=Engystomops pustulosus TaxID=76066 RepID=A0AAV7CE50_ENGPU|nr:hypothetical protein GDO81_008166 [Engystomops pustulosus]